MVQTVAMTLADDIAAHPLLSDREKRLLVAVHAPEGVALPVGGRAFDTVIDVAWFWLLEGSRHFVGAEQRKSPPPNDPQRFADGICRTAMFYAYEQMKARGASEVALAAVVAACPLDNDDEYVAKHRSRGASS